jgi:hypothetical protein
MRLLRGYMIIAEVFELVDRVPSVFIDGASVGAEDNSHDCHTCHCTC